MPEDLVRWGSTREREVAIAAGYRVVALANGGGTAAPCQVQRLQEAGGGRGVAVAQVWPGDAGHLALWNALMDGENGWTSALGGEENVR